MAKNVGGKAEEAPKAKKEEKRQETHQEKQLRWFISTYGAEEGPRKLEEYLKASKK